MRISKKRRIISIVLSIIVILGLLFLARNHVMVLINNSNIIIDISFASDVILVKDDWVITDMGIMQVKYCKYSVDNGYCYIKYNQDYSLDGENYKVGVFDLDKTGNIINEGEYQFKPYHFNDWTMMPFPYKNNWFVVVNENQIKQSFTIKDCGDWLTNPECLNLHGENHSCKQEESDCFTDRTVWIWWEPESEIVEIARKTRAFSKNDEEYADRISKWVYQHIKYDKDHTEKVEKYGVHRKASDLIFNMKKFEERKGVCLDKAAIFIVMMRSQGIPCKYIQGYTDEECMEAGIAHAWAYYKTNNWTVADPTNLYVTREYIGQYVFK